MKNSFIKDFQVNCRLMCWFMICLNLGVMNDAMANEKSARQDYDLDNIIVTAQKQQENIQDVPVSITVFDDTCLEDRKVESVKDLADFVPNLMIFDNGQPGANSPSMRGIHAVGESSTVSTGLYVNGVPTLIASGYDEEMYDIERIEVLRGPQVTLYGKNTQAGVINIITKVPDNEFRGKVSGQLGEDNKRQALLNISTPIVKDRFFMGVSGRFYEKDGIITHADTGETMDDRKRWSGRTHLRWTPIDDLDLSFIASRFQYDDGQAKMNLTEYGYTMYGQPANGYRQVRSNMAGENDSSDESFALKAAWHINDALTLTSITTRREYNDKLKMDWDFSRMSLAHSFKDDVYSKLSQELRLDSKSDRLNWLFGLYYDDDDIDTNMVFDSVVPSMAYTLDRTTSSKSYAAFAHLSYLLMEKLSVMGGIRYETSEFEHQERMYNTTTEVSWDDITPKIALQYRFTPGVMGYVNVSKGYRTGGFNMYATDSQYFSYDPEYLWSYEVGFKSTFLNKRMRLNGALFYMDISDMQVNQAINPAEGYVTNAAEATAIGGELEVSARITNELTLMAGLGMTKVEFDKFEDALGNYEGNKVPFAPDYTFNIGAQYRHTMGFFARIDWVGYGEIYFDKENNYSRDPYQLVNAKIGYEAEQFDVYLYAKNLFDKTYDSKGYYSGYYTIYSDPREAGLQLVYRF